MSVYHNTTTARGWRVPSSSYYHRRTHPDLWLTGLDGQSRVPLGHLNQECDDEGVQERTRWTPSSLHRAAACCCTSTPIRRWSIVTCWLGAGWHQSVDTSIRPDYRHIQLLWGYDDNKGTLLLNNCIVNRSVKKTWKVLFWPNFDTFL